jgi:hypothetical protein
VNHGVHGEDTAENEMRYEDGGKFNRGFSRIITVGMGDSLSADFK